jgi:hypothetical protein
MLIATVLYVRDIIPYSFTVFTVQLLYPVKEKGGDPDRKPYPLPYGLRNQYRNLKSENSQDYAQKTQRNSEKVFNIEYDMF